MEKQVCAFLYNILYKIKFLYKNDTIKNKVSPVNLQIHFNSVELSPDLLFINKNI